MFLFPWGPAWCLTCSTLWHSIAFWSLRLFSGWQISGFCHLHWQQGLSYRGKFAQQTQELQEQQQHQQQWESSISANGIKSDVYLNYRDSLDSEINIMTSDDLSSLDPWCQKRLMVHFLLPTIVFKFDYVRASDLTKPVHLHSNHCLIRGWFSKPWIWEPYSFFCFRLGT